MPMELAHSRQDSSLERIFWSMIACRWASVPGPCVRPASASSSAKSKFGTAATSRRNSLFSGFEDTAGAVFLEELGDLDLFEFLHGEGGGVALQLHFAEQLRKGVAHANKDVKGRIGGS